MMVAHKTQQTTDTELRTQLQDKLDAAFVLLHDSIVSGRSQYVLYGNQVRSLYHYTESLAHLLRQDRLQEEAVNMALGVRF